MKRLLIFAAAACWPAGVNADSFSQPVVPPEQIVPKFEISETPVADASPDGSGRGGVLELRDEDFLAAAEKRRIEELRRIEYENALAAMAEKKREREHEEEVRRQAQAFVAEFLKLNIDAGDFPEKFADLMSRFPLAGEEDLAGRMVAKGRRALLRSKEKPVPARATAAVDTGTAAGE